MPNPDDRRSYLIHLTAQGDKTRRKAATGLAKQADFLLEPLAPAERQQLIDSLTRIADHWDTQNALNSEGEQPRTARALQALEQLASGNDH